MENKFTPPPMPEISLADLPPEVKKPPLSDFLIDEATLAAKDIPPTKWLFPMLLPSPALVGLVGRPGAYKTFFAHWIARRLSQGKSLFNDHDADPEWKKVGYGKEIKTLIIEEEMGEEIVQERVHIVQEHKQENIYWMMNSGFNLGEKERVEELVKIIEEKEIKLLVLDPFVTIAGLKDENDNAEASKIMKILLDKFVNDGPKITVIFIHHPSKSSDGDVMRGAGDILGKCYMGFAMDKIKDSTEISVKCVKSRWHWPKAFKMELQKQTFDEGKWYQEDQLKFVYKGLLSGESGVKKKNELLEQIMHLLKTEYALRRSEISSQLGRKTYYKDDKSLNAALREGKDGGVLAYSEETYTYSLMSAKK
jgi:hypothetical protein|tara:strand:- start:82 stop:1176 length:1095 start_codon:yes stop_codon:yes gene_type:complete